MTYNARVFPGQVGGGPGVQDTVVLTVTVGATANPVAAVATRGLYNELTGAALAAHDAFSDIVMFFSQYANPVSVASDGNTKITLGFEQKGLFTNQTLGRPGWLTASGNPRQNAFDLCAAYVADNDHGVTAMTVTINGTAQSAT